MKCGICDELELGSAVEQQMQACITCANTYGLVAMPPPTRPNKPCATCGGTKFLRTIPREHSIGNVGGELNMQTSTPMMLTFKPRASPGVFSVRREPLDISRGWGWLEVYACYDCGRVEWFCTNVRDIPIHPHLMTDIVDYGGTGPYR